jgi:hypothetical protein
MTKRINPALPRLWRDPVTMQLGIGRNSVELPEITNVEERIIELLQLGIADNQSTQIDHLVDAAEGTTKSLLERLGPAVVGDSTGKPLNTAWLEQSFAEIVRVAYEHNVNPQMVLAERASRLVHIDHLDGTGLILMKALGAAGISQFASHDRSKVTTLDLSPLGYRPEQLGVRRADAAVESLSQGKFAAAFSTKNRSLLTLLNENFKAKIDIAILVSHRLPDLKSQSRMNASCIRHINIEYSEDSVSISPILLRGETPCLSCFQKTKSAADETWPAIATQLTSLPRDQDDVAARLTACGLSARLVIAELDRLAGFTNQNQNHGYRLDRATGNIERFSFDFAADCACRAAAAA